MSDPVLTNVRTISGRGYMFRGAGGRFVKGSSPFSAAGEEIILKTKAGLDALAEMIMDEALQQCPIETGTLRASAHIEPASHIPATGVITCEFGFGYGDGINPVTRKPIGEYAVPVHEIIEAFHKPPTKAKFLEDPVYEHAALMEAVLAEYIELNLSNPVLYANILSTGGLFDINVIDAAGLDRGDHPKGTSHSRHGVSFD